MASGYYGNGYNSLQPSSFVPQKPRRDPNWELNQISEEQTSIFTEPVTTRRLSAIGFLEPRSLNSEDFTFTAAQAGAGGQLKPAFWSVGEPGAPVAGKSIALKFFFEDVYLQNCYGIEVERISLGGIQNTAKIARRNESATEALCADVCDDEFVNTASYFSFNQSKRRGVHDLSIREVTTGKIHNLFIFGDSSDNDGYFTGEEFIAHLKTALKNKLNEFYPQGAGGINVEFYFDGAEGRFVLAWELPAAVKAIVGHLEIAIDELNSPIMSVINRYFVYDKFKRNNYTYGTVTSGDGISYLRSVGNNLLNAGSANFLDKFGYSTSAMIAVSPELTKFAKDDSLTPVSVTGEIATFYPFAPGEFGSSKEIVGSKMQGNLFAPKLTFDPNETISSFTVEVYIPESNQALRLLLSSTDLNYGAFAPADLDEIRKRLHLVVDAKLF